MCRRLRMETRTAAAGASYTGETVRLGTRQEGQSSAPQDGQSGTAREGRHAPGCYRHGHFPLWALWFIWPLAGFVMWLVPAILGAIAAVAGTLSEVVGAVPGPWPVLLIIIGIMLLRRR